MVTETCIRSEYTEAISHYLLSGGLFTDIQVPRKLFDMDSLIWFGAALNAELAAGAPHQIKTLIDMLKEMILSRILKWVRLI